MEEDVKTLGDYISIAWRRKFHILIPFVLILAVTVVTVFVLPPVYRSTGTILIESQQIPEELIQSTVTSFADERIQVIRQRIMTSQQLFGIIDKFGLYAEEIDSTPRSEVLEDMRARVGIDRVSANVRGRGRGSSALIAFTVSFEHRNPSTAQKVANELVTLFLDENIRTRTARAEETSEFLKKESERLGSQIAAMEGQIAEYKQENEGSLPESLQINLQRAVNLKAQLLQSDAELNHLNDRKKLLIIELDTLELSAASGELSEEQRQQKQELTRLQNEFISLSARYGENHPDVKAIKRQLTAFEAEYGNLGDVDDLREQQRSLREEMVELINQYSSEHPDVKLLERKLKSVTSMIDEFEENTVAPEEQTSPKILQTRARLESIDDNIARIRRAKSELQNQIAQLDTRISRTPQVERGLDALERDYENTRRKYQEMKAKQLQAELSRSLEEEQKGERFTLLEPPLSPDRPVKPDRPKLFLLGLVLSIVGGLGVAGIAEALDGGIRGSRALASLTKMTPLVTIPYISTRADEIRRKRILKIAAAAVVLIGIAGIAAVHFFYKPLDLLWYIVLRKLNLA
jgi:uncharacterized protein involved in exopolysaccharide biosynthesis